VQHLGRVIVAARIFEGGLQFLFQDAKKMAQIVGVGLDFATVFLTRVVEAIGEWEWTRLWENLEENLFASPISMQNWEMSVVMEKTRISPPEQEKAQSAAVLLRVALFFMIEMFMQNLDVGNLCNFVVKGVATTLTEEHHLDIGQVYAKSNDPGTEMLGLNLWEYFMKLNIMKWPGTRIAE
jgi:hypothetical protein